jgi:hypothetical protein
MIYDPYIDNQEKAFVILSRWRTKRLHTTAYFAIAFFALLFVNLPLAKRTGMDFWLLNLGSILWMRGWYLLHKAKREFVEQMTPDEMDTLARATTTRMEDNDKRDVKLLTKAYRRIYPEREYLRPSQSTQDDGTLLRAAVSTETTPQDQLLRPSNNDIL